MEPSSVGDLLLAVLSAPAAAPPPPSVGALVPPPAAAPGGEATEAAPRGAAYPEGGSILMAPVLLELQISTGVVRDFAGSGVGHRTEASWPSRWPVHARARAGGPL